MRTTSNPINMPLFFSKNFRRIAGKFYLSLIFIGFICLKNFSQTIDFENIADYTTTTIEPFELDNSYFQTNFCVSFYEDNIGGTTPRIGKVGLPAVGYNRDQGPLTNSECGQDDPTTRDMPNPGQNVGCYFLTTNQPGGPRPLVIDYQTGCDCSEASGVIMDIDGNEAWQIEVFDNDASNTANFSLILSSGDINTGDAVATPWEVGPFNFSIEKIIISFVGAGNPGFAFDNFSACSSFQMPIPCTENSTFHQVLEGTDFVRYDPATLSYEPIYINNFEINAMGYNVQDGFIYGIRLNTNHLVRVGSEGVFFDLGEVPGLPIPTGNAYVVGDFDLDGNLYVYNAQQLTTFHKITITDSGNSATNINISPNIPASVSDFSFLPANGLFYGLSNTGNLYAFDPVNETLNDLGGLNPSVESCNYGASYADNNGFLYFFCNSSGNLYKVNPVSLTSTLLQATGITLSTNDGASCALSNGLNICGSLIQESLEYSCGGSPLPNSTYTHTLQFQNNTEYEVTSVVLNGITPEGVTLSSQFFNFYQNPIPPGGTSEAVEIEIQLEAPLAEAQEVCFDVIYLTDQEQCCHYQHCVLLEPVDPCEFLRIEPTETDENCCYEINPVNDYCADFFVGIQMDIQTDGVVFSSFNENNPWLATPNEEMTAIFWSGEEGNLPLGTLDPMSFCLGGISSANQIPQTVVVSWIVLDPATGEEIVYCEETLEFFCEPCLILDGLVECSNEGAYSYNFSMTNNSDHVTNMIVFEVHTSNVILDPPFIVTPLNPGDSYTDIITITSEDGNPLSPNMEIEFKAVLYDAEGWCCHLDDLSILLPDCAPLPCDCPGLTDFTQQVQAGFTATFDCQNNQVQLLANNLGPCDEIEWVMQPLGPGGLQNIDTAGDVPAQFNFSPGIQYRVVMSAQSYEEDGTVCSPANGVNYIEIIANNCLEATIPHLDIPHAEQALPLFPVPASSALKIAVPEDGFYEWTIFNANGQQIEHQQGHFYQNQAHSLDIADLPEGIFFMRLKHENGEIYQARFVKVE